MRKRKRNWPQRVLKYRAYPREIPQTVWEAANRQRELWNRLVTLANDTSEWVRLLGDKKAGWAQFDASVNRVVQESGLDWVNGPDVGDRLKTAVRSKRWPRYHGRWLDRVTLSHRFTGGGTAISKIVDNKRASRFALESNPQWATKQERKSHAPLPLNDHWHFRFQVGDSVVTGALNLDKLLPIKAILKRVALLGERAGVNTWYWHLALTIEEPPEAQVVRESEVTAGLDLGWRVFADGSPNDYLRVGMLADSEGRMIELRLPLRLKQRPDGSKPSLAYLNEVQARKDDCLNAARDLIGDRRLGAGGIKILITEGHEHAEGLNAILEAHDFLRLHVAQTRFHMIQRRRWYYRNIADWLCNRYQRIALERDMELPRLHERSDDPALQAAAVYRNYAAVGELRQYLKLAAAKYVTELDGKSGDTTKTCWLCGVVGESGANLDLTCINGHTQDQDQRAALNLFSQIDGSFGQSHELRNFVLRGNWKRLKIPEQLRTVAVEVPLR